ncbi:hypothetical protein CRE_01367 [Caenorhabditis remanei]|uniref:PAN-3 domain-containing protein n=1 Tax=Caenorhabditis remanei TaxID=31234 RepID=E3ND83_CAERE|nr:hypothetical protein CRE_01367 [Caenorhabditis remanei]
MIVVYGKPVNTLNATSLKNTDWNSCLSLCYYSTPCLVAWQHGATCFNFNYTATGPVTKLENGSVVAFKVDNPGDQCPSGTNPPTFNNNNATGSLYVTDLTAANKATWVYYTIYLAGITWNFTYTYNTSCPIEFVSVIHADGSIVCFKQWTSNDPTGFSYNRSVELCTGINATLAGISYPVELNYIKNTLQSIRNQVKNNNTYVRIDGKRTGGCQSDPTRAACKTVDGFKFSDPTVKSLAQYEWITDSSAQEKANDNCIVLVVKGSKPIQADVRSCDIDSPLQPLIVICKKPAWIG